ncbi:hypothetical protein C8Q70DRAFT_937893 [Cubamyces menziesii]|nr:hypothetical protein C8Q70DRAFT_937893 [Cubamyces menziesii]
MPAVRMSISHVDLTMVTALVLLWTKISSWLVILILWRTDTVLRPAGAIWISTNHHSEESQPLPRNWGASSPSDHQLSYGCVAFTRKTSPGELAQISAHEHS